MTRISEREGFHPGMVAVRKLSRFVTLAPSRNRSNDPTAQNWRIFDLENRRPLLYKRRFTRPIYGERRADVNPIIAEVVRKQLKTKIPSFRAGDTLRVAVRIVEGDKDRIQNFEGVCIGRNGDGMDENFTVRRVSFGVGMERIFPIHSPRIESVKVLRHGHARRAKLYYLRELTGKKARLTEAKRKRLAKDHLIDLVVPTGSSEESVPPTEGEAAPAKS